MGGFNLGQAGSGALGGAAAGSSFGPWGTAIGGGLGGLFGGFGGGPQTNVAVPSDLAGPRSSQINLLQSLLGGGSQGLQNSGFFGNLNVPQSGLQQQSSTGISQYLNQPSPEMRALNTAMPSLQEILTPGTMNPQFAQDLSLANQQGGRFSSANEILKGEAFRNLFNQRNQAAQTLGALSSTAGQADFGRLIGAYGIGQQQAQQADVGNSRYANLLSGLLGQRQQLIGGLPITQQPGLGQQIGQAGIGLAGILPYLFGGGGGGSPGNPGQPSFGGIGSLSGLGNLPQGFGASNPMPTP